MILTDGHGCLWLDGAAAFVIDEVDETESGYDCLARNLNKGASTTKVYLMMADHYTQNENLRSHCRLPPTNPGTAISIGVSF